jgi:hypothetical protein
LIILVWGVDAREASQLAIAAAVGGVKRQFVSGSALDVEHHRDAWRDVSPTKDDQVDNAVVTAVGARGDVVDVDEAGVAAAGNAAVVIVALHGRAALRRGDGLLGSLRCRAHVGVVRGWSTRPRTSVDDG